MYKFHEGNIFTISNDYGHIEMEDDYSEGASLSMCNDKLALSMTALYSVEEIDDLLQDKHRNIIMSNVQTKNNGTKKILESCFRYKYAFHSDDTPETFLIFISEDTRYTFHITEEEYEALIFYLKLRVGKYITKEEVVKFFEFEPDEERLAWYNRGMKED